MRAIADFFRRIFRFFFRYWYFTVLPTLALIGVAFWLFFGVFAFHLELFNIDDKVDEDVFVFTSGAVLDMSDEDDETSTDSAGPATSSNNSNNSIVTTDSSPIVSDNNGGAGTNVPDDAPGANEGATEDTTAATTPTTAPASSQPGIRQSAPAEFMSRSHRTTGQAFLFTDGNQTVLRIENLKTDNGPDLDVYLVPISGSARASEYDDDFVDLGDLQGNIGDQFYEVPPGTDLSRYSTAVIWCVRFNVAFGTVELNQIPAS